MPRESSHGVRSFDLQKMLSLDLRRTVLFTFPPGILVLGMASLLYQKGDDQVLRRLQKLEMRCWLHSVTLNSDPFRRVSVQAWTAPLKLLPLSKAR